MKGKLSQHGGWGQRSDWTQTRSAIAPQNHQSIEENSVAQTMTRGRVRIERGHKRVRAYLGGELAACEVYRIAPQEAAVLVLRGSRTAAIACWRLSRTPAANCWSNRSVPSACRI
jgi:hypothetical protein